jgi:hypothetical protein
MHDGREPKSLIRRFYISRYSQMFIKL